MSDGHLPHESPRAVSSPAMPGPPPGAVEPASRLVTPSPPRQKKAASGATCNTAVTGRLTKRDVHEVQSPLRTKDALKRNLRSRKGRSAGDLHDGGPSSLPDRTGQHADDVRGNTQADVDHGGVATTARASSGVQLGALTVSDSPMKVLPTRRLHTIPCICRQVMCPDCSLVQDHTRGEDVLLTFAASVRRRSDTEQTSIYFGTLTRSDIGTFAPMENVSTSALYFLLTVVALTLSNTANMPLALTTNDVEAAPSPYILPRSRATVSVLDPIFSAKILTLTRTAKVRAAPALACLKGTSVSETVLTISEYCYPPTLSLHVAAGEGRANSVPTA